MADKASLIDDDERQALTAARDRIRAEYLFSRDRRPPTTGRGIHHTALICRDLETTVGLHHLAISGPEQQWHEIRARLDERNTAYDVHSGVSIYTTDPDGARIEFLHDPLGEMYGEPTV